MMIQITPHMRILVAVEPIDFRAGIDTLVGACRKRLQADPFICGGWKNVADERSREGSSSCHDGIEHARRHIRLDTFEQAQHGIGGPEAGNPAHGWTAGCFESCRTPGSTGRERASGAARPSWPRRKAVGSSTATSCTM